MAEIGGAPPVDHRSLLIVVHEGLFLRVRFAKHRILFVITIYHVVVVRLADDGVRRAGVFAVQGWARILGLGFVESVVDDKHR